MSKQLTPATSLASSMRFATSGAGLAVDGNLMTRWESVTAVDPQWLDVDFGAPVHLDEVDILWEAACAKNYDLEISNNGTTWTTIQGGTVSGNTVSANQIGGAAPTDWSKAVVTKPLSAVGRYLRVNGTTRCTMYGYSIWELRALGDVNASCTP